MTLNNKLNLNVFFFNVLKNNFEDTRVFLYIYINTQTLLYPFVELTVIAK